MIAEKRKLFFSLQQLLCNDAGQLLNVCTYF